MSAVLPVGSQAVWFEDILVNIRRGDKVGHRSWPAGHWIRAYLPGCDSEFGIREEQGAVGTFMPYFMYFDGAQLRPWAITADDILNQGWYLVAEQTGFPKIVFGQSYMPPVI